MILVIQILKLYYYSIISLSHYNTCKDNHKSIKTHMAIQFIPLSSITPILKKSQIQVQFHIHENNVMRLILVTPIHISKYKVKCSQVHYQDYQQQVLA